MMIGKDFIARMGGERERERERERKNKERK